MTEATGDRGCPEKARLLRLSQACTTAFDAAVTALNERMGTASKEQYDDLRRTVEERRRASAHARRALKEHVARHGC